MKKAGGKNLRGFLRAAFALSLIFAALHCVSKNAESESQAKDCGSSGRVTFNGNGATSGTVPGDQCVVSGSVFFIGGNTGNLERAGFAFQSWNSKADGTGSNYAGNYQALNNGTLTLYAKWILKYSVTYDANGSTGGTIPSDGNLYIPSASVTVLANTGTLVKTGFVFASWNTKADGTGTNYAGGALFSMGSANVTLYAKWAIPYTLAYDGNGNSGGSAPTDSNIYIQGQLVSTPANTGALVRKGYTFGGWNTLANGLGTNYNAPGGFLMGAASLTLYAKWTPNYRDWYCVTSSSDGTKLAAGISSGQLQTSTDSGMTWTARESSRYWYAIASSGDGTKLVATASNGRIYTSTDSGASWTARDSVRDWLSVASSSDGTKLVAGVGPGLLYTSTDSGVTWTARESSRTWKSIASSSDGTKLVAVAYAGQIYTSTDSGVTWTARESVRNWYSVASSGDGTKLVAVVYGGQIYTSTDSGVNWSVRESARNWYSVASSSDGTKLVAGVDTGLLYTSTDSGATWTARDSSRKWISVASSADGVKLVAVVIGGWLFSSIDSGVTWSLQY